VTLADFDNGWLGDLGTACGQWGDAIYQAANVLVQKLTAVAEGDMGNPAQM